MALRPGLPLARRGRLLGGLAALLALGAVLAPPAASATPAKVRNSISLTSQTDWLTGPGRLVLGLSVRSSLPPAELGIRLVLYSCLTSRSAFDRSLSGTEPPSELVLSAPTTIPLRTLAPSGPARAVSISAGAVPAVTAPAGSIARPNLAFQCAAGSANGVYPLEVALVDTADARSIASFTTHVVFATGTGLTPLRAAVVLPFGASPALAPASMASRLQASTLLAPETQETNRVSASLAHFVNVPVSVEVYAQFLLGLERSSNASATRTIAELRSLVSAGTDELLDAPFADVAPAALADAGLTSQMAAQLRRAAPTFSSLLGATPSPAHYVVSTGLNDDALETLTHLGVRDLVLPTDSFSLESGFETGLTQTAPFVLSGSGSAASTSVVAAGADPGLASYFDEEGDPVLAAHQLLAELAQIYYDLPDAAADRGVVVAPTHWTPNAAFIQALLSGLGDSPVLMPVTLSTLFDTVHVGANGDVAGATVNPPPYPERLNGSAIRRAAQRATTLSSVVPGDAGLLAGVRDSVFIGESTGLSPDRRSSYVGAPQAALNTIASSLSFGGGSTISITEQHARIPITIVSSLSQSVRGLLVLSSSALSFAAGNAHLDVLLSHKDNPVYVHVTARSSGVLRLTATIVSPDRSVTLARTTYTVRSTAFSTVAILTSAAALLVLAVWWFRSIARHRRRVRAERRSELAT